MLDESEDKTIDLEEGVNALQGGELCYFCKKPGHKKRDCKKLDEWKKKNPNQKYGNNAHSLNARTTVSCHNCGKEGHISRECRNEKRNHGREENGRAGGGQMAEVVKALAAMQEVLK